MRDRKIRINIREWLERKFEYVDAASFPDVRVNCAFCHDTRGRHYIAVEDGPDEKKGFGWCQNEQIRRDFFDLFAMLENLTDGEAAEQLYDDDPEPVYAEIDEAIALLEKKPEKTVTVLENPPVVWPKGYTKLWGLSPEEFASKVPKYMTERRLDQHLCDKYLLGFSVGDRKFGGRLIVPIYQHGQLVGFQGRGMHPGIKPKYLFMDGIKAGEFLFNLDYVPPEVDEVILTEGVFDVWGMIRAGFPNTVASFGKHLTPKGIKTLTQRFKSVLLMWDMDAKPEILKLALELQGQIRVRTTFLSGKDPDEAEVSDVVEAVMAAQPFSPEFEWDVISEML